MGKLMEIRWHGRGGQGAKTGALLLGEAVVHTGRYMQAFPDYGPERMGAPMRAFNRVSDEPIVIHSGVESPQVVVVLDATLLGRVDVTEGLPGDGILIVNTSWQPKDVRSKIHLSGRKLYTIDANRISTETIGKPIPNTPMLGALVKVTGVVEEGQLLNDTREKLSKKFRNKPEVIEGNIKAIERAFQEVRSE
ncbi:MAG TPA: 2-oxoacid:acceptor oxidoreductase family protein [Bacillota bacterium]|nr:2-oxoacid:acceptor oxidoreductase family protein [Bacillota bacterium]